LGNSLFFPEDAEKLQADSYELQEVHFCAAYVLLVGQQLVFSGRRKKRRADSYELPEVLFCAAYV
jgi:hypothetical protein